MKRFVTLLLPVAAILCMSVAGCAPGTGLKGFEDGKAIDIPLENPAGLTPAQQYAGEILSYMMLVVLGDAGTPETRKAWKTRGREATLDQKEIAETMNNPEKDKSVVMVMDPDILGLSEVLYHYDKNLNQFKGQLVFNSVYPSTELIGLRLLLLQKRSRGEKIRVKPLVERKTILLNPAVQPSKSDLMATNLNAEEMTLLKAVFESDPRLYQYLKHPFVLSALERAGFIEKDTYVNQAVQQTRYRQYRCGSPEDTTQPRPVTIVFLPSIIDNFAYGTAGRELKPYGFTPEDRYQKAMAELEKAILDATEKQVRARFDLNKKNMPLADVIPWKDVWRNVSSKQVRFIHQDRRPFVIFPDNAEQAVHDICPRADLYVIILGKDVYRSIDFSDANESYPIVNRLYLDFTDVKYAQVSEEIDEMARFIYERLDESHPFQALMRGTEDPAAAATVK